MYQESLTFLALIFPMNRAWIVTVCRHEFACSNICSIFMLSFDRTHLFQSALLWVHNKLSGTFMGCLTFLYNYDVVVATMTVVVRQSNLRWQQLNSRTRRNRTWRHVERLISRYAIWPFPSSSISKDYTRNKIFVTQGIYSFEQPVYQFLLKNCLLFCLLFLYLLFL